MSDNVPTVQLLLKELKDVTDDWKLFGLSLGVPVRNLNTIKLDDPHGGVENWKLKMFEIWLQYKPDASWKDVVRALNEKDYNNLAAKLSRKYLLAADSQDKGVSNKAELKGPSGSMARESYTATAGVSGDLSRTLTASDLCDVLTVTHDLNNWKELGLQLGLLLLPTLEKIDREQQGRISDCKIHMLSAWLKQQDNVAQKGVPSWNVLRAALWRMREHVIADKISN